MGRHKELTEMQRKFAYELVTNEGRKTKYECAIDAGLCKRKSTSHSV
jgi:phage terminase small subunit